MELLDNNQSRVSGMNWMSRRSFVKFAVFSGFAWWAPARAWSAIDTFDVSERSLSLYNPNTRQTLRTVYWADGRYVAPALEEISYLMRDRLTGQTKPIDTNLLDLLHTIGTQLQTQSPFHIESGYRSRKSNEFLRRHGKPAAKNSFHLKGKAADIHLPGCKLSVLRDLSSRLQGGGVGYYPRHGFVHIDVGPVRYWSEH